MRGSITPRGDGVWRLWPRVPDDYLTGGRKRPSKTFHGTRDEAEVELTAYQHEIDQGIGGTGGDKTLRYVIAAYIDLKSVSLEANSLRGLRNQLTYIPDRILDLAIGKLEVEHLEALYTYLAKAGAKRPGPDGKKRGLKPKSVKNVHQLIRGALEMARRRKWITANPAVDAEKPKIKRRRPTPAPAGKLAELLAAAADVHPLLPLYIRVQGVMGGRRSEAHGLRWSGVNFTSGLLTVRDVIVGGEKGEGVVIKPRMKNDDDDHQVYVGAHTLALLLAHHDDRFQVALAAGLVLAADGFVFTDDPTGATPWRPETTARRFSRACAAAGIPTTTRLHDLRALCATYLFDEGFSGPAVSGRLGQSDNSVALDIYGGRVEATDIRAAEAMERLYDG